MKIKYRKKTYELVEDNAGCDACVFVNQRCSILRDNNGNRLVDYCSPLWSKNGYKSRVFIELAP